GTRGLERPIDETIEQWKSLGQAEIDRRLDAMSRDARVEVPPERTQLSWAEVAEMSAGGVSFGSHSASHAILTQLEVQELRRELEDSLTELRRRCIDSVPVFCYPNGDYNDRVVEAVAAAGYTGAFTTDFGCETPVPRDLFRLRRIGIHQDICGTIPLFAFHLAGLNQALAGAARRTLG
ncbi:MAG: polysaccharide deacetylase family protein, partial [Candidatus Rokuibacteriota bacterium]